MKPTVEILQRLRSQIDDAAREFGVSRIRVFGSVARGTANEGSDIDLLVAMDEGRSLLDLVGFEQAIEDLTGLPIDVVAEGGLNPRIESTILEEARQI